MSVIIRTIAQCPQTNLIGKMETESSLIPCKKAKGQRRFARWFFVFCCGILAVGDRFAWADEPNETFSIQVIEPYRTATLASHAELSLDESQILQLACRYSEQAELVLSLAKPREQDRHKSEAERKRETAVCLLANVAAEKIRAERTAAALKAHYGLSATLLGLDLIKRTEAELAQQMEIQTKLIEAGVSIPDDSLLARLRNETIDSKLKIESKERSLRIQLSGLISSSYACSYRPIVKNELTPCDIDVCEYVQRAMDRHYELIAFGKIHALLGPETVELGNELLALISKVPALPAKKLWLVSRLKSALNPSDRTLESNRQKNWMSSLISERQQEIVRKIEIAYEEKRTAALRWSVAKEQLDVWSRRVEQLEKLGAENRGTIAELGAAKLSKLKDEARVIELWLEWQVAEIDLKLAMGECVCRD
ncbi:MAG: hypothetical protein MUC43_05120 [Pirellula sp.]|nr:hypothetical protein [Pirellula sp.]